MQINPGSKSAFKRFKKAIIARSKKHKILKDNQPFDVPTGGRYSRDISTRYCISNKHAKPLPGSSQLFLPSSRYLSYFSKRLLDSVYEHLSEKKIIKK